MPMLSSWDHQLSFNAMLIQDSSLKLEPGKNKSKKKKLYRSYGNTRNTNTVWWNMVFHVLYQHWRHIDAIKAVNHIWRISSNKQQRCQLAASVWNVNYMELSVVDVEGWILTETEALMMINIIIILENEAVRSLVMRDKVPNQYADERHFKLHSSLLSSPPLPFWKMGWLRPLSAAEIHICGTVTSLITVLPVSSA